MSQTRRTADDEIRSGDTDELSLLGILAFLMQNRRLVLGVGIGLAAIVGTLALLGKRTYSSTARFMPETSESSLSQLSGLAATFGVSVLPTEEGASPSFYSELLQSRDVLRETVETRYAFRVGADSMRGTLVDLFRIRGTSPEVRRDLAAKVLLKSTDVTVDHETGTVDLKVKTPWAELSQEVASRMIELVSDFNLHRRQTKAGAERRFVEARVAEARDSLRAAEERLEGFLQRNRVYQTAPQLQFEHDRLQRAVTMQQQVYTTLAQSYEAARIDEVRNTPVITVVEPPDLPPKPDSRLALVKALLAGILGLAIGACLAAARRAFARAPAAREPAKAAQEDPTARGPRVATASGPFGK
jgi:uncharacterized protein involved in exopolysaccharide biosynthesis